MRAIFARDQKYGIGKNNDLPWPRSKTDLSHFKKCTECGILVMGRKTWESIGSTSLPGRESWVLTSADELYGDYAKKFSSIDYLKEAIEEEEKSKNREIWVIGGAEVFNQLLPLCEQIYETVFDDVYKCDTFISKELLSYFGTLVETQFNTSERLFFNIWRRHAK